MKSLPSELQLGLQLAACIGTRINKYELDILSRDEGKNLHAVLSQVSEKGYMNNDDNAVFRFAHDKIEQACYESMSEELAWLYVRIRWRMVRNTVNSSSLL